MKTFLGIDSGEKRVGLALGDDELGMARPWKTLVVPPKQVPRELAGIVESEKIDEMVLGLPRNMDGSEGPMAEKARVLGRALEELTGKKVHYWDERLTSVEAGRQLREAGRDSRKARQVVDQAAAALLLQSFLDAHPTAFELAPPDEEF